MVVLQTVSAIGREVAVTLGGACRGRRRPGPSRRSARRARLLLVRVIAPRSPSASTAAAPWTDRSSLHATDGSGHVGDDHGPSSARLAQDVDVFLLGDRSAEEVVVAADHLGLEVVGRELPLPGVVHRALGHVGDLPALGVALAVALDDDRVPGRVAHVGAGKAPFGAGGKKLVVERDVQPGGGGGTGAGAAVDAVAEIGMGRHDGERQAGRRTGFAGFASSVELLPFAPSHGAAAAIPPSPRSGESLPPGEDPGVARSAGWGVESRTASSKVRCDVGAILPASKQRAIPHPALRAAFPGKAGEGVRAPLSNPEPVIRKPYELT